MFTYVHTFKSIVGLIHRAYTLRLLHYTVGIKLAGLLCMYSSEFMNLVILSIPFSHLS